VGPLTIGRLAFLFLLGALTYVLHKSFHYPLKMPGHHGLEAMALLVIGRLCCTNAWSATIVCLSSAATASLLTGGHDASSAMFGLAPGLVLDGAVMLFKNWRSHIYLLPLFAALGHATKPLLRFGLFETAGITFGSLRNGVLYPLSTHFVYGLVGGVIAVIVWKATVSRWHRT
jgi:hypothetical protein